MDTPLPDDILNGADEIAPVIREPLWRTYRLLEGGHLPAFKQLGKWTSTRSALRAHYDRLITGGEAASR
jgi:hypothetical protein